MTGEITLSGRVLPIGGRQGEGARRSPGRITRIVIPRENEADLDDLRRRRARQADRVAGRFARGGVAITLRDTTLRDGRLWFSDVPIHATDSQLAH